MPAEHYHKKNQVKQISALEILNIEMEYNSKVSLCQALEMRCADLKWKFSTATGTLPQKNQIKQISLTRY